MSISDITLNSKVYSLASVNGASVVRNCTAATLPTNVTKSELVITHTPGTGDKPDRHLVKLTNSFYDSTSATTKTYTLHAVATVPKGQAAAIQRARYSGVGAMGNDVSDLFALDTCAFLGRILNGEFS